MANVFDIDGINGRFAMYTEPAVAPFDGPLTNPNAYLPLIKIHSDLNYLQVVQEHSITINHPNVPRPTSAWSWSTWSFNWYPTAYSIDRLLATHNLGYIPQCIVAIGNNIVEPGVPVQTNSSRGVRYVSIYATSTQIRCVERVDTGNAALAAFTATYRIMLIGENTDTQPGVLFDAEDDRIRASEGKFDSDFEYLRSVVSGDSPFYLVGSQNIDTEGGVTKSIAPNGAIYYDFYDAGQYTGSLNSVSARAVAK